MDVKGVCNSRRNSELKTELKCGVGIKITGNRGNIWDTEDRLEMGSKMGLEDGHKMRFRMMQVSWDSQG
ncbi:hypothetical protein CBR_g40850 [Chara braunii]|uniref:Uncharacterized protein n=1 Tax=Chara braunii TaxID=69332 RepID=A0A388K264_CHABU|nr:hypothetical protein CBR_g40850 [Chara braunii]|eukprot:GBG64151.1 hypothetical protein CBR_g40850 [Chara braunii]